ncbi:AMP-binding protein [Kitasatospora sp. MMS16-BH015]|uniref:AMP-binding protein n=1 Tax=Kitasatospora sp. MMS16-BH015 TaxID=2018025 RepID=UPI000CA23DD6|nr:AMP-binding protein [Kitasatospora sp. MMS16-BH015]AUG76406.1 AMP-binding protein [Kitasatospora sp. MMS16-BH015]
MTVQASYSSGSTAKPLLTETIGACLRRVAAERPGGEALVDVPSGRRWTYAELDHDVDELARDLRARGVVKGDRVGIWAPNCPEWVLVQYATARLGAVLVNINPAYRAHELAYVLDQAGISLLVSATSHRDSDYRAMVAEVAADCPGLRETLWIGDPSWQLKPGEGEFEELDCHEPINVQYTSGTTGFPKGATLSHHNILNNAHGVGALLGYTEQDRICVPVPFYHCFGMVLGNLAALSHRACVIIPAAGFDPAATLRAVAAERATSLYGVPTMFIAELGLPDFASHDLSSLRTGLMGGSPCPVEVMKKVTSDMHMAEVAIAYGMTETSPVSTLTRHDDDLAHRTETVGRVMPHVEVKIADPATGATVDRGTPGELRTRGYSVMLGYWDDPERTAEAVDEEGWMHTGDLAVMHEDGYVAIVGRIKDMIIRGGENVYPREIEEFLHRHPEIVDVQVVGVPDERYGEEVFAFVILRDPAATTLGQPELAEYCRGQLARYKTPRHVLVVDSFPMTVSGKVRKTELRELAERSLRDAGASSQS